MLILCLTTFYVISYSQSRDSFNKIAVNISNSVNWPQTIFQLLYLENIKVRQPTNTKIFIYIYYAIDFFPLV